MSFPGENTNRIVRSIVPDKAEGVRLDSYLAGRFTYRSRTAWRDSIRRGVILLNGNPVRCARILHAGEEISMDLSKEGTAEPPVRTDYRVIAETPDFLVIDKPGNLPVHPSGRYFNHTLQRLLLPRFENISPVNRLDRETSGLVLFAKNPSAARKLSFLFSNPERGKISKVYFALVFGRFPPLLNTKGFLENDPGSPVRKKRRFVSCNEGRILPDGAETCATDFILRGEKDGISLVECRPYTGRLHQIRATLLSCGFPLAGDKLYGPDDTIFQRFSEGKMTNSDRKTLRLERQALHAAELAFVSPFTGKILNFYAPLPGDFLQFECVRDFPPASR